MQKTAVVSSVIEYGRDGETEKEYRARVTRRFKNPPLGGALADYRMWASEAHGVLNVYPYKDENSPSGVLLYISGIPSLFPDRIPSTELLIRAGEACTYDPETGRANRKPMTAVIDPDFNGLYSNVKPVLIVYFDVYVDGVNGVPLDDYGAAAVAALENYFLGREPYIRDLSDDNNKTNIVSKNNIASALDHVSTGIKAEFEGVVIRKNGFITPIYSLREGELAALKDLYLNGALYEQ